MKRSTLHPLLLSLGLLAVLSSFPGATRAARLPFNYTVRDIIAASDVLVVGKIESTDPFDELYRDRTSYLSVEKVLYGMEDSTEVLLKLHWKANVWGPPDSRIGISCAGQPQLSRYTGQRVLWLLSIAGEWQYGPFPIVLSERNSQQIYTAVRVLLDPPARDFYTIRNSEDSRRDRPPIDAKEKFKIVLDFLCEFSGAECEGIEE